MKKTAIQLAKSAGQLLTNHYGNAQNIFAKQGISNIVTEADIASERLISKGILETFPDHSIISEETGCSLQNSPFIWVIDPLDGTSNFAASVPWFGILIAVFHYDKPIIGVMYLPITNELYVAERGQGAFLNDHALRVTSSAVLSDVLWAYGMDAGSTSLAAVHQMSFFAELLQKVRNIRATNSLIDAAYTASGRFGGMVNHSTRIWDIAAPSLIVQEAGGMYTDVRGEDLCFDISSRAAEREYAVTAGAPHLHQQVVEMFCRKHSS